MERPAGVTVIAVYYLVVGAYACLFGALKSITSDGFTLIPGATYSGMNPWKST